MAKEPHIHFDDPGLKTALRRTHAGEKAPAGLRERVTAALAAEETTEAGAPAIVGRIGRASRMRIAASFIALLGIGVLAYTLYNEYGRRLFQPTPVAALPATLTSDMIERHDAALADATLNSKEINGDLPAIGKRLANELGKPVAAFSLGNGWTLKAATISNVGANKAAQIIFQRGQTTVSMFSIPITGGYPTPDGTR